MGLGLNTSTDGGGQYNAILKYDARAGRMFRVDREQGSDGAYTNDNVDVTTGFSAVMDLASIQVGWASFRAGQAPDFRLVPLGQALPPRPEGMTADKKPAYQQCFKVMLKLGKSSGGDVRELASSAKVVIGALDALHTAFEGAPEAKAGKLPVVLLKSTTPVTSGQGGQKSTNYAPVFEIMKWVDRPEGLDGAAPKAEPAHAAPQQQPAADAGDDWD